VRRERLPPENRLNDTVTITENLSVGGQPGEAGLAALARAGVRTVVNLRADGEPDQPLSPRDEGERVRALGMEYVHIPVSMKDMTPELVDWFREEIRARSGRTFVHCHKGKRAGAFAMMHRAVEAGMGGDETLAAAEQMGFACDAPALKDFVKGYVDGRRTAPKAGGSG
jgi:uncharacterized protein (TIGR01244 family)